MGSQGWVYREGIGIVGRGHTGTLKHWDSGWGEYYKTAMRGGCVMVEAQNELTLTLGRSYLIAKTEFATASDSLSLLGLLLGLGSCNLTQTRRATRPDIRAG